MWRIIHRGFRSRTVHAPGARSALVNESVRQTSRCVLTVVDSAPRPRKSSFASPSRRCAPEVASSGTVLDIDWRDGHWTPRCRTRGPGRPPPIPMGRGSESADSARRSAEKNVGGGTSVTAPVEPGGESATAPSGTVWRRAASRTLRHYSCKWSLCVSLNAPRREARRPSYRQIYSIRTSTVSCLCESIGENSIGEFQSNRSICSSRSTSSPSFTDGASGPRSVRGHALLSLVERATLQPCPGTFRTGDVPASRRRRARRTRDARAAVTIPVLRSDALYISKTNPSIPRSPPYYYDGMSVTVWPL